MWRVWCSIEDVVLIFGTARHGKSGLLGNPILDAVGAVITTSTKPDLYHVTNEHRAQKGPVHVYNPTAVGGIASTISFNPVTGCEDPVTAAHRAEDMLPLGGGNSGGSSERTYWVGLSREVFAALLHTAALGGQDCHAIARWVAEPDEAREPVLGLLNRSPDPTGSYSTALTQFFDTNPRTRSSIAAGIRPALAWLINPAARAAASGAAPFDVARLLRERGTLYLLGDEQATTSALVAALTGHIAREAKKIAAQLPGGRLDPALLLALDEAAGICPVPLQRWTADFGSHGITIVACFQSRAQLIDKWGAAGAASILNNAGGIVLFGGTNDEADLRAWSTLFGDRDEPVVTTDATGQVTGRSVRSVPVFSTTTLATLPKARVVVKRRHMAPVIGRAPMYWRRWDVRQVTWSAKLTNTVALARANRARAGRLPRPRPAVSVTTHPAPTSHTPRSPR
jgi:type IV secretory pathway TraG/TraD family ATPase VirD4